MNSGHIAPRSSPRESIQCRRADAVVDCGFTPIRLRFAVILFALRRIYTSASIRSSMPATLP